MQPTVITFAAKILSPTRSLALCSSPVPDAVNHWKLGSFNAGATVECSFCKNQFTAPLPPPQKGNKTLGLSRLCRIGLLGLLILVILASMLLPALSAAEQARQAIC